MDDDLAHILSEPPDPAHPYVYRGTRTHINKFGILNPDALDRVTRAITALRLDLLRQKPLSGKFDLEHLRAFHHYIFQDVYDWAGELRIVDFDPNRSLHPFMRSGNQDVCVEHPDGPPFAPASHLAKETEQLLGQLPEESYLGDLDSEVFAHRLAYYLAELYNIHPFRDGNGRTIRAFLGQLANNAGWIFDLDAVPQLERHLTAFSAHCGDMDPLRNVVRESLTKLS